MKSRKKYLPHLLIALLSFIGIVLLINTLDPKYIFDIFIIKISAIIPFFFLLFLAFGGTAIFLLKHIRRGILVSVFIVSFLLLQYLRATNIFYVTTMIVITFLIEFLFWKKKG